jgi:hypothetical protein
MYADVAYTDHTHIHTAQLINTDITCRRTRDQRPETRDQRPETRDQRPETRDQRPATSDQRPATSRDQQRPALTKALAYPRAIALGQVSVYSRCCWQDRFLRLARGFDRHMLCCPLRLFLHFPSTPTPTPQLPKPDTRSPKLMTVPLGTCFDPRRRHVHLRCNQRHVRERWHGAPTTAAAAAPALQPHLVLLLICPSSPGSPQQSLAVPRSTQ